MASSRNARWFLVEWGDGSLSVVNVRSVINGAHELKVGDEVTVTIRGTKKPGKVVNLSGKSFISLYLIMLSLISTEGKNPF